MRRIAFIHEKFPFGGAEVVTMNVISSLQKLGYYFYIFTPELRKNIIPNGFTGVEYIELPYNIDDKRNIPILTSEIKSHQIDIFISPVIIIPYLKELREATSSKFVFVCHNIPFWETSYKVENGKHSAKKNIFKWLEWYLLRSWKFKSGAFQRKIKMKYLNIYNNVDAFGVLCDDYGQMFANELNIDHKTSKFVTLTNTAYPNLNYNKNKNKEVCFVGRLSYADKRVDRLLKIWQLVEKENKEWILNIVGDGTEIDNLKKLSEKLSLERVFFKGFSPNPKQYYDNAAIVCLTSSSEGWGLVLTEAQANGCAAIAFDCSAGVRTILSPSWQNGVLVEPYDINAYASALLRLMDDEKLRNEIAQNGQKHIENFSEEKTTQQWINMINKLLQ